MVLIMIIGFVITIISIYITHPRNKKPIYSFSFEGTIGATKVPVVSFMHKGKIVNFVVDSGASNSLIYSEYIELFDYKTIENVSSNVCGIDGNRIKAAIARIELTRNNIVFSDDFQVVNIPGLDKLKSMGVVGILGTSFFRKYNFVIDFVDLKLYSNG